MRFWRHAKPERAIVIWPPFVDRLFKAVGSIIKAEGMMAFPSAWEFDHGEGQELFEELKAAYEDILLIDSPEKADAAAQRMIDTRSD